MTTLEAPRSKLDLAVTFTDKDRCDSCGSRAYARAEFIIGPALETATLLFCGHHFTRFQAKISAQAIEVIDNRHLLFPPSRTASGGFV
jgi:hypothetical protein